MESCNLTKSLWRFPVVIRKKIYCLPWQWTLYTQIPALPRRSLPPSQHPSYTGPLLPTLKYTRPHPPPRISIPCPFRPEHSSTSSSQTGSLISWCSFTCIFSSLLFQPAGKSHKDTGGPCPRPPPIVRQTVTPDEYLRNERTCVRFCAHSHHSRLP